MKQYFVIHSTDPYLLARMCTDLQMEGCKVDLPWCETCNPFNGMVFNYLMKYPSGNIAFHSHDGIFKPMRYSLTKINYLTVLTKILSA